MTTPMEIDADILTTDVPEVQPPLPQSHEHDADTSNAITSHTDTTNAITTNAALPKKKGRRPGGDTAAKKKDERVPGTTTLPVARVKRILGADEDLQNIGREALFLLSVATEQFLKRMADSGYLKARMDGRKTITLKDLSSAVKQHPEMEFLSGWIHADASSFPCASSSALQMAMPFEPSRADIVPAAVPLSVALASKKKNAQDPQAFSALTNQPLSSLLPPVPMLPSRNPDFPDALVRRMKDPSKTKARKSAAGAGAEEGDPEPEEGGTSVKKPVKAKPRPRKSVPAEEAMNGEKTGEVNGLEKTLAEQAAKAVSLSRPKPTKKIAVKVREAPVPVVIRGSSEAAEDAMDDGW